MIFFLAVLAVLLVAPSGAMADPISSAIAGFIINTFGVGVAGFGTAFAIANFATRALLSFGFSLVGQMLQKKPKVNPQGIQTEQTTTGDVTPQKFIIGRYAVEGHLVAPAYSHGPKNKYLTYILEVSNIPVTGLTDRIIVDGKWSAIDDDPGNAHADYGMPLTDIANDGTPRAWLRFHDGTQTTADAMLVDKYGDHPDRPWTTDHILEGTAYAVLTFEFDQEVFSGLPSVRFEVDGIKLYDPRSDTTVGGSGTHRWEDPATWEFTQNPQVINYNILRGITLPTGDIYGGRVPAEDIPLDNWFAAMNACDATIGDRVTYQAGFEVNTNEHEPADIIMEMNRASFAQFSEFGGVFRVRVGAPAAPVMSLTDADILITENAELRPFPAASNISNAIAGTYVEPNDLYQGRSADLVLRPEWETEDGERRTRDIGLPAVTSKSQVQHLLNSYLNDERRFRVHRIVLPPSYAALEPLDTISWTSEENGYTSKIFEVVEGEDSTDALFQAVVVREREAGDVDWEPSDDVPQPQPVGNLTPPADPFVTVLATPSEAASLVSKADTAFERTDAALEEVSGSIAEMRDRISGYLGGIGVDAAQTYSGAPHAPLADRFEAMVPEQQALDDRLESMAQQIGWGLSKMQRAEKRMADAGIYEDPEDGTIKIAAFHYLDNRVGEVSIDLDAAQASIELRATYADVDAKIAEAQLDEVELEDLTALKARVTDAEIDIDALEGAITLKADTTTVDGIDTRLVTAEADIDSLESTITLKVDQTDFDAAETRLTTAEQELSALDGASITQTVIDTRRQTDEIDAAAFSSLGALWDAFKSREALREGVAFASQEIHAKVNEGLDAEASARLALGVKIDDNAAAITSEQIARADSDSALASDISTLQVEVGNNAAAITTIEGAYVDADGAVAAVEQTISAEYNGLTAMAEATTFAEATADGIKAGYVMRLNNENVWEVVSVSDGTDGTEVTGRWKGDYLRLDGDVEVTGDFKVAGENMFAETITANEIEAGGITRSESAGSGAVTNNSSTWTDIALFTMNLPISRSSDIVGIVSFRIAAGMDPTDFPNDVEFRVTVEGNTVLSLPRSAIVDQGKYIIRRFVSLGYDGNGQGGGVRFQMRNAGGYGVNQSSLTATAFYR